MTRFSIDYYVGGKAFACRGRDFVPCVGDHISFKEVIYRVDQLVWLEDSERRGDGGHVVISISEVIENE